jgi:CsoR family transcriptional regulator, copper-sensing transcriptional repressor
MTTISSFIGLKASQEPKEKVDFNCTLQVLHLNPFTEEAAEERDCPDILLQIAAVRKALGSMVKVIFVDYMESCLVDAVQQGNEDQVLNDLKKALDNFIR